MMASRLSQAQFLNLRDLIQARTGVFLPENKLYLVESRLLRSLGRFGFSDFDQYMNALGGGNADVLEDLLDRITTHHTLFFREPLHFEFLSQRMLPSISPDAGGKVRIWSAACSTGEEPYSIAMIAEEYRRLNPSFDYLILATDISRRVIQHGHEACYEPSQCGEMDSKMVRRYMRPNGKYLQFVPDLRKKVHFRYLNLLSAPFPFQHKFHIIFCRNVLLYFESETIKQVLRNLCDALCPGGQLVVSLTERIDVRGTGFIPAGAAIFIKEEIAE